MLSQIVAVCAFNKTKYANDPGCDVDFETMRLAKDRIFAYYYLRNLGILFVL